MGDNSRAGETSISQALAMLEAFASVGVTAFDVTLTDIKGEKIPRGFQANRTLDQLRRSIGPLLESATRARENLILRPRTPAGATLIQLDDLAAEAAARIGPHAFMVLCTSPANFQAWVAVKDAPADFARRLRKGAGADPSASGATRCSGSQNFKSKYAPAFPTVRIISAAAGKITMVAELDSAGLVAPAETAPPPRVSLRLPRSPGRARPWPSYTRCVQNAPPVHRGERPDISRADFTWCRTAYQWAHSVETITARLLQLSDKARQDGEKYAHLTAENAARSVDGESQPPKSEPRPA
jgi:hypothetical protein